MKKIRSILCVAIVAVLAIVPAANAQYLMTRHAATAFAKSDVSAHYIHLFGGALEDNDVHPTCRPQDSVLNKGGGIDANGLTDLYHRWACSWKLTSLLGQHCTGSVLIMGSSEDFNNTYYRASLKPARCKGNAN
jgi:hypothetical protein